MEFAIAMWFDSHNYMTKKDYLALAEIVERANKK